MVPKKDNLTIVNEQGNTENMKVQSNFWWFMPLLHF